MELKFKIKLTPKQMEVFIQDWHVNYSTYSFQEYLDMLLDGLREDIKAKSKGLIP